MLGLSVGDMSQNAVANLGWTDIQLKEPVFVGDTIYAESICTQVRPSGSRPGMGIVGMYTRGLNQDGVDILSWNRSVMMPFRRSAPTDHFPVSLSGPFAPG